MNVVFVDDEPLILKGIKRAFYNSQWQIHLSQSGMEALSILKQHDIDIVVTDMRMPQMDGAELLETVTNDYPDVVRIVLSGHSNEEAAKRASFVAHQWFNKPCDPKMLHQAIKHIEQVRKLFPDSNLRAMVGKIKSLPSPPKTYMQLNILLKDNSISMDKIGKLISDDPGLSAKILQLTNSSFFVQGNYIYCINEAIKRLGLDIVCSIVIAAELYSQMESLPGFSLENEQARSLSTARLAASLVDTSLEQETLLVGLFHNLGNLILCEVNPDLMATYINKRENIKDIVELEQSLFHVDHTQLSGYLLHLWNFPYNLIENVLLHQQPEKLIQYDFGSSAAVYIARCLLEQREPEPNFVKHFNLEDKLASWQDRANNYAY